MSRKHNARHERGKSHYPERLEARGLSKSPVMPDLDRLRAHVNAESFDPQERQRREALAVAQGRRPLYYGPRPWALEG